jgi:hypothetical protein
MGIMCFLCGPCRGVILKISGGTQAVLSQFSKCPYGEDSAVSGWQFRRECSGVQVSRKLKERIETRSTAEYKRSACEDVKCELKTLCVRRCNDTGGVTGRFHA